MIAIDMTFIILDEIKKGFLYKSFSVFAAELIDEIIKEKKEKMFCIISYYYQCEFLKKRFPNMTILSVNFIPFKILYIISNGKYTCSSYLKKMGIYNHVLKRENVKGIWYPYALPQNVADTRIPYILTIHDMIMYKTKNLGKRWKKRFKKIVQCSKGIVAISEETKKDVCSLLQCKEESIITIPNSITISKECEAIKGIRNRYILDINGFGEHKNTLTLIKAYNIVSKTLQIDLVCCGGWKEEQYYNKIRTYIDEHRLQDKVHLFFGISEKNKNWLLENATLFVTPSLSEGFGRTPIEAAMCKVPVISTKEGSLYEVTKGKVHYYENPMDYDELSVVIKSVLTTRESDEYLEEIAREFKNEYASSACLEKYMVLFKKLSIN